MRTADAAPGPTLERARAIVGGSRTIGAARLGIDAIEAAARSSRTAAIVSRAIQPWRALAATDRQRRLLFIAAVAIAVHVAAAGAAPAAAQPRIAVTAAMLAAAIVALAPR